MNRGVSGYKEVTTRWLNLRRVALAALIVLSICPAGCQWTRAFHAPQPAAPVIYTSSSVPHDIISNLNAHSARVRQIEATARVSMDGMPTISGNLIVEQPRRMRLRAGLLGMSDMGVDVGSNDHEFWVWSKSSFGGNQPMILHARHDEFNSSPMAQALQLQPQWIIDSLGLVLFDDSMVHDPPRRRPDGRYEIHSHGGYGDSARTKVTVVDGKYGWILQQTLYDAHGQRLAYSNSTKHQYFPQQQASIP